MKITNLNKSEIKEIFNIIKEHIFLNEEKWVRYVNLGCKIVKIISFNDNFLPLVEKQLTFVLEDSSKNYDDTLYIWNEKDILPLVKKIIENNQKINTRIKFEKVYRKAQKVEKTTENEIYNIQIIDETYSKTKPIIDFQTTRGFIIANDFENNEYFYNAADLSPEEFIKEGHIFVQFFNNILKTDRSNLIHGAVIGYNNNGICFCARGQRGKSTLSVLSMLKGFEYVSDDYLILHQNEKKELLSSPIYSIITLSPEMYNRLYDLMDGVRFVSNNARKDKYVFNIANFHDRFRKNYPIKLCIFPEIVTDKNPQIRPCTLDEKGRAIVQIVQSTLSQTQDLSEHYTVKKIINMVKNLPFYKFNLCYDIDKNTEFLREFMLKFKTLENKIIETSKIALDITFDLANILDTEQGIIYSLNKFATNIYENLINSVPKNEIISELKKYLNKNQNIIDEFEIFVENLNSKNLLLANKNSKSIFINDNFAIENNYKLSMTEYKFEKNIELIKLGEKNVKLCTK